MVAAGVKCGTGYALLEQLCVMIVLLFSGSHIFSAGVGTLGIFMMTV